MTNIRIPMDMHNTFRECHADAEGYSCNTDPVVHPSIRPLIAELSRARPMFEFVAKDTRVHSDNRYASFSVECDGEQLGTIDTTTEWRTGTIKYALDSRSLRYKRQRGNQTVTKDLKKAVKLVLGNFIPMTPQQISDAAAQAIGGFITSVSGNARYRYDTLMRQLQDYTAPFLLENMGAFKATITSVKDRERADTIQKLFDEFREGNALQDIWTANHPSAVVKLQGSKYVTRWAGEPTPEVYTAETLPDSIRGPLGMLKLVEPATFLPNVGVRGRDDTFFVIGAIRPRQPESADGPPA